MPVDVFIPPQVDQAGLPLVGGGRYRLDRHGAPEAPGELPCNEGGVDVKTFARRSKTILATSAAAAALIASGLVQAPMAMAATDATSTAQTVPAAEIDAQVKAELAAGATKVDVVNPTTGEVIRTVKPSGVHSLISLVTPGCSTTSVCIPGRPPYAYEGKGTINTNIQGRNNYRTGKWTSQVKYTVVGAEYLGTLTAEKQGPGGSVVFGQYVNIKQVRIF